MILLFIWTPDCWFNTHLKNCEPALQEYTSDTKVSHIHANLTLAINGTVGRRGVRGHREMAHPTIWILAHQCPPAVLQNEEDEE